MDFLGEIIHLLAAPLSSPIGLVGLAILFAGWILAIVYSLWVLQAIKGLREANNKEAQAKGKQASMLALLGLILSCLPLLCVVGVILSKLASGVADPNLYKGEVVETQPGGYSAEEFAALSPMERIKARREGKGVIVHAAEPPHIKNMRTSSLWAVSLVGLIIGVVLPVGMGFIAPAEETPETGEIEEFEYDYDATPYAETPDGEDTDSYGYSDGTDDDSGNSSSSSDGVSLPRGVYIEGIGTISSLEEFQSLDMSNPEIANAINSLTPDDLQDIQEQLEAQGVDVDSHMNSNSSSSNSSSSSGLGGTSADELVDQNNDGYDDNTGEYFSGSAASRSSDSSNSSSSSSSSSSRSSGSGQAPLIMNEGNAEGAAI